MQRQALAATVLAAALQSGTAAADNPSPSSAGDRPVDRAALITRQPFNVQIVANGRDVSASSPVVAVRYDADGSGTRTLRDGSLVRGRWRFLNPQQTQIEVEGPEGTSRWVVIQLDDQVYRKANIDTGIEFIHRPVQR